MYPINPVYNSVFLLFLNLMLSSNLCPSVAKYFLSSVFFSSDIKNLFTSLPIPVRIYFNMHKQRISKLRKIIKGTDAFIITELNNIYYLSGFTGSSAVLVVTQKDTAFFTDFRYKEQSAREVKNAEIVIIKNSLWDETLAHKIFKNVKKIGFEPHIEYATYEFIKDKLKGKKIIPLKDKIENLRTIKENSEIVVIKKASKIADASFKAILPLIKPGVTEEEIAMEFEFRVRKNGGSGIAFKTIIASGPNAALPHARASSRKIKPKDTIVIDFGAIYNRYVSDCTRTLIIGDNPRAEKIYKIVEQAQKLAIKAIKPGVSLKKLDAIARDFITKSGYGKYFGHSLGHGVGLEVHESPKLSTRSEEFAKIGMVFSVEPGIYLPGFGGVRIEDLALVTPKGPEILTHSPYCLSV